ncbi:bactofilin family protein [Comamonas endophytica]|uniref:Polymer-forming cytoskeletal protein n=1 Tax=Comamonas endophytica TaxID=2949090 RepID=A0ABY6G6I5_9BURK|nr:MULTISPECIES: polymer-forming cytoskeletal protein [unclassified Acidovorax]MCD2511120.1 polymer-forming cytoskeletal protein [Acidovorax sp. D4N7]UYG50523.1 polymer-forming cytoskeletal protein [Acidovorax sp. 5MLIR]
MAVQNPFFGKRDNDSFTPRSPATTGLASTGTSFGASQPAGSSSASAASTASTASTSQSQSEGGSRLIVGPNIKLKGVEITDCDTLVVEGTVEATMDSRVIEIAEQGAFHGTAEIDVAEIRGVFDGTLVVRQKLVIYGTGKVSGKIRYGKVVIEEGGELTGQIEAGPASKTAAPAASKASDAAASAAAAIPASVASAPAAVASQPRQAVSVSA